MPDVQYHLHPAAENEILEKKRMLLNSFKCGLITAPEAQRAFINATAEIITKARIESSDDRMIDVTCPDCNTEHRMRADVVTYHCRCNPHKIRFGMAEQTGTSRPNFEHAQEIVHG